MPATLLRPAASPRLRDFQSPLSTVTPPLVLVQSATATNSSPFTTNTATFGRKTTAGNILWAAVGCDKQLGVLRSVPAGFQAVMHHASASVSIWVGWKVADGTETSLTIVKDAGSDAAGDSMWIGEFASADTGVWTVLGKATAPTDESTPLAATSGTTAPTTGFGGGLAFFAWDTITTLADLTRYSNGFTQIQGALSAGGRGGLYVAMKNGINQGTLAETTQTRDNSDQCSACIVVFNKIPAPVTDPSLPVQILHPGVAPSPRSRFVPYQIGAAAVVTGGAQYTQALTATLSFTGSYSALPGRLLTGTLSFTGAQAQRVNTGQSATLSFTGAQTKRTVTSRTGVLSFTGSAVRSTVKSAFTGVLSFAGSVGSAAVHHFTQALTATLSFAGAYSLRTQKLTTAALSFTGALVRRSAVGRSGVLSFTGVQTRRTGKLMTAALSFAGALNTRIAKLLGGVLSFTGAVSVVKVLKQTLTATLSFTGTLSTAAVHQFTQALTATLSFTGAFGKRTGKALSATLSFTAAALKTRTGKLLSGTLSFTGAQSRRVAKRVSAVLSFLGAVVGIGGGAAAFGPGTLQAGDQSGSTNTTSTSFSSSTTTGGSSGNAAAATASSDSTYLTRGGPQ